MLQDALDGRARDRPQVVRARQSRDVTREQMLLLGRAVECVAEVRLDLEELAELGIVRLQQVVQDALAEQHHLDVERDRFGLERRGADQTEGLTRRLDHDLGRRERPLEGLPCVRLGQHLARIEHEVPAVGQVERPGPDEVETGGERPELRLVVDAPDDVLEVRVVLRHHRGTIVRVPADQHVDAVAVEDLAALLDLQDPHRSGVVAAFDEAARVLDDVGLDGVEVSDHVGFVGVRLAQVSHQVSHDQLRELAVELVNRLAQPAVPARNLPQHLLQLLLQVLDRGLDAPLLLRRELAEVARRDHLPVLDRREQEPERCAYQTQPVGARLLLHRLQGRVLFLLRLLFEGLTPRLVLLALEGTPDDPAQLGHERIEVVLQARAPARGKAEVARCVGPVEAVDVAPVRARGLGRGAFPEHPADWGVLAGRIGSVHEDVVAFTAYAKTQGQRLRGALLAEEPLERFEVVGGLERQRAEVTALVQPVRIDASSVVGHAVLLFGPAMRRVRRALFVTAGGVGSDYGAVRPPGQAQRP